MMNSPTKRGCQCGVRNVLCVKCGDPHQAKHHNDILFSINMSLFDEIPRHATQTGCEYTQNPNNTVALMRSPAWHFAMMQVHKYKSRHLRAVERWKRASLKIQTSTPRPTATTPLRYAAVSVNTSRTPQARLGGYSARICRERVAV